MFKVRILVLALALIIFTLGGCAKTMKDYRKVETGWTLAQVEALLGTPDEVKEAQGVAALWVYRSQGLGGDGSILTITAVGDKVFTATIEK